MISEYDDEFMMKVLEGEEVTVEEIKTVLRKAVCSGDFFPVLAGAAYKNKGVVQMLDAVVDYLPSPLDVKPIKGTDKNGDEVHVAASDEGQFVALAFKIMTDPFVGKLTYFRVYSGSAKAGSYVYNATKGKKERLGRVLLMHANHREEIEKDFKVNVY